MPETHEAFGQICLPQIGLYYTDRERFSITKNQIATRNYCVIFKKQQVLFINIH